MARTHLLRRHTVGGPDACGLHEVEIDSTPGYVLQRLHRMASWLYRERFGGFLANAQELRDPREGGPNPGRRSTTLGITPVAAPCARSPIHRLARRRAVPELTRHLLPR